jgi:Flp pilus assembly protein TadG
MVSKSSVTTALTRFANRLTLRIVPFLKNKKANIAVTFALAMVPAVYLLGMALDYSQAVRKQSQLNAAIDAAAISAVTPSMLTQPPSVATATATSVFNATANGMTGLSGPPALSVNITNSGLVRTATVSYTAASTNSFPTLLSAPVWPIKGSSSASASGAPNINFYLLLDDSPSMAIAANQNDINTLMAATALGNTAAEDGQSGCGFACHESNVATTSNPKAAPVPAYQGGGEWLGIVNSKGKLLLNAQGQPYDNYALARSLNLTLRIDLVSQAVANLMTTAQAMQLQNNNTYKAAIYTFDYGLNTIYAPSGLPTANLSVAGTQAANNIQVPVVYQNNWLTASNNNEDTNTNFSSALQSLNTIMPAPGGGTSNANDTPQEVVFLVTDGVEDKVVSSKSACSQTVVGMPSSGYRCQQPFDTTWCTTVKNRGIRIAVLYTEYLQLPTDGWYMTYDGTPNGGIAPFNSPDPSTGQIATNLQACASPGLFYDVQTGGDINGALQKLFQLVVATAAHLTH